MSFLHQTDPELESILELEKKREKEKITLIASENYVSRAVLEAEGSVFTNKYAEGYPGKRYYGGCDIVDMVEKLAIDRAKELFKAEYANVQPHAGSQANMAAYFSMLNYGDTVLAMRLDHGGHLTHGDAVSFSGKSYNFVSYSVEKETGRIDYREMERLALKHRPKLIVTGATAYPRIIDFEYFRSVADKIGARFMVDIAHIAGLVAVGLHPSPVPYADVVTSTTHKTLRGPRSGFILCKKEMGPAVDSAVFPHMQGGPLMHSIAAMAVCFHEAMQPAFYEYQKKVIENTATLAKELQRLGCNLVSGGTDNHLMLIDLTSFGVTGIQVQRSLERANIISNRNKIPYDTKSAYATSGLRLGAAAVSSRGFGVEEMKQIAAWIVRIITNLNDKDVEAQVKEGVLQMCSRFPVPGIDC